MNYNLYVENTKTNQIQKINFEYNGIVTNTGSIEMIDNYLSRFKNLDIFITNIYKENQISFIPDKCYIINNANIKLEPIFNNNTIKDITSNLLSKKELHVNWNAINELINKILNYTNSDSRIFKSISNTKEITKLYYYFINNKIDDLKLLLFNDYTLYRNLYAWLNKYELKYYQVNEQEDNQITIDSYLENKNKPYRLVTNYLYDLDIDNNKEELEEIAKEKKRLQDIKEKGIYSNELIEYYYNNGGLESVLENVSLDDIESLTPDEQEYIGYRKR